MRVPDYDLQDESYHSRQDNRIYSFCFGLRVAGLLANPVPSPVSLFASLPFDHTLAPTLWRSLAIS
jgi:hypothetical protein